MAKDQRIFKMIIDGDISNLEKSMDKAVRMMKDKYGEMDKAADKVTHLKDLVDYITQIDRGLDALHTKDPQMFKKMFDGMDVGLKKMMEEVFGTSKSQLSGLDMLRDRLATLTDKSSVAEIKEVAKNVNQLYEAIGQQAPIKLGAMNSKTKGTDIEQLKNELLGFATVWENVNKKLAEGFSFGGTISGGGSGGDGLRGGSAQVQAQIDALEKQINEYRHLIDVFEELNRIKTDIDTTEEFELPDEYKIEESVDSLKKVIETYRAATKAVEQFEQAGDTSSVDYFDAIAKASKAALSLHAFTGTVSKEFDVALEKIKYERTTLSRAYENTSDEAEDFLEKRFLNIATSITSAAGVARDELDKLKIQLDNPNVHGSYAQGNADTVLSAEMQAKIDKIKEQIAELNRIKSELNDAINLQSSIKDQTSSAIPDSVEVVTSTNAIRDLMLEFDRLAAEIQSGDKTSVEYTERLTKMSNVILVLRKSLAAIKKDSNLKGLFDNTASEVFGGGDMLTALNKRATIQSGQYVKRLLDDNIASIVDGKIAELENEILKLARAGATHTPRPADTNRGAGVGSGMGTGPISGDINIEVNSEQLEQAMSNLAGTFGTLTGQVETSVTRVIASEGSLKDSIDELTATMRGPDDEARASAEREQQVEYMKQNLLDMFKRVSEHNDRMIGDKHTRQETTAEFFADGTARFNYGESGTVGWNTTLESVLSNILSQSIMSVHSHPWGDFFGAAFRGAENDNRVFTNDSFSGSKGDLAAWRTQQRYGSQIGAMLTGNILKTFDTSKIGQKYFTFISHLRDVEKEYAAKPEYSKYFKIDSTDNKVKLQYKNDLMGWQEVSNALREVMFEALKRTGFDSSDIQNIYKEYDLTNDKQLTDLASTLVELSSAAQSADSHIDALKGLLMEFGTSDKKKEAYDDWRRLSNTIASGDTFGAKYDLGALRDTIRDYAGNAFDAELNDIFSKDVDAGNFSKAAQRMRHIIETFGTDIESKEGQVALESLRKGELSVAEVWNRFSNFAKVSQDAIDQIQVIDAKNAEPADVQLMSRMASTLDAISSNVASIEANTQMTLKDSMDANTQTLMSLFHDGNANRLTNGANSLFDKNNISEFKALELYKLSDNVSAQFRTMFDGFEQAIPMGDLLAPDVQNLFELYVTTVQRTQDALNQVNAYNTRYETDLTHPDTGELLSFNLEQELQKLTGQGSQIVDSLLNMFAQARQHLANDMALDSSSEVSRNDYSNYGENSDLGAILRTLAGAIDGLVARLGGAVNFDSMQSGVTDGGATNTLRDVDLTSEINQCDELLRRVREIEKAIDQKTDAFEDERKTVDRIIPMEIETLKNLGEYLGTLRESLETLFTNIPQGGAIFEAWKNDLIAVKENLDGIVANLQTINTLAPKDGQGVGQQAADQSNVQPDGGYALNTTVNETNRILGDIFKALGNGSVFAGLADPFKTAAEELKKVSSGIIEEHKRKKVDTSAADARLTDSDEVASIQQAALDAVSGRMMDGGKSAVTSMTAMKDGVVKVTGWIQTATDAWEGFTVQVNEAGQASKTTYDLSAKAAKQAAAAEKEDNPYEYDRAEVEARAKKHLDDYTAQGKKATVQFKDSGRYTITVLEEVDGLSKQIFQTFDENDTKIERTTATMSNAQKIKLEELKKIIDAGVGNSHVGDEDTIYKQYKTASDELERMNGLYQTRDDLSNDEILNWNAQIKLVQQLGSSVESLINKRKVAETSEIFKSERSKKLSKFDLDKAELAADINIPNSFNTQLDDARKKIENAVDDESLKIAINEWDALKNKIKQTATEQDLYIKKTKESSGVTVDKAQKARDEIEKQRKLGEVKGLENPLKDTMRSAGINPDATEVADEHKEIKATYDDLIKKVTEYRINVNNGQQADIQGINDTKDALIGLINTYKQQNNITDARKTTFGASTKDRLVSKFEGIENLVTKEGLTNITLINDKLEEYRAAITRLQEAHDKFNVGDKNPTGEQRAEFDAAREACNKYGREITNLIAVAQKSKAANSEPLGADFVDDVNGRRVALLQYMEDAYGASATVDKFTKDNERLFFTINNGDGTFSKMCAEINKTRSAIDVTTKSTERAVGAFSKFFNELKSKFASIGTYLMASFSIQEVWQQVRKGVEYVREIDAALTELKKVTDETDAAYEQFLQNMSKTAGVVGSTVSDLTTMAAEWSRLGYSMAESAKLAESTAILLNVSEFSDATQASEALISTMQAFQYTADESQHVVDILNEVGNNYAISSDGIATALQDSASALMEGGNNLEQATALVAAANRVVNLCHGV